MLHHKHSTSTSTVLIVSTILIAVLFLGFVKSAKKVLKYTMFSFYTKEKKVETNSRDSDWSVAVRTGGRKTIGEIYVDSTKVTDRISQATQFESDADGTGTLANGVVKIDIDELKGVIDRNSDASKAALAQTKVEAEEKKIKTKITKESKFSRCFSCSSSSKGVLQGHKKSIPKNVHFIQYWYKQLKNRINRNKLAIVVDSKPEYNITYQELDEFSNSVAYTLKHEKFSDNFENRNPNGELIIAVCHPASYEYIVIVLAILKLGCSVLPIGYELPAERIAEMIKLTRPILTIIPNEEDELINHVQTLVEFDVMHVDDIWDTFGSHDTLRSTLLPFKDYVNNPDPAKPSLPIGQRMVLTTVLPSDTHELQAVSYNSRSVINRVEWEDHFFVYVSSENVLLPPMFDSAENIVDILTPLCVGVTLVLLGSPYDFLIPDQLFMYCNSYKVRRLHVWPALLKACTLAMQLFDDFSQLIYTVRYWFCIGGFLRVELGDMFFEVAPPLAQLIHMYHYEDCISALTFHVYESGGGTKTQNFYSRLPVGYSVPNVDIYILGENMQPVKEGETGEIFVTGLQLPIVDLKSPDKIQNNYYFKNPFAKKSDINRQLMIRTFDTGRITQKGNGQRILVHEMTQARHYYVEEKIIWLIHIELYLKRMTHLVKASHCVCYRPNEDDQLLLAFCILNSDTTYEDVEDELRKCLHLTLVPEVIAIDKMPTFERTGLPDENQLLKHYQNSRNERNQYDWNSMDIVDPYLLRASKILAYCLLIYLGIPVKCVVETYWNESFLNLSRATASKGCFIVKELHRNRYPIFVNEFICAESLKYIAIKMVEARRERGYCNKTISMDEVIFLKNRYKLELMIDSTRCSICNLLARAFTQRDQLDYFAEVSYKEMRKYFDNLWPLFVSKKLSLVVRKKKERNKLVGAVLNMSWHDELELSRDNVPADIAYKLELIHYLEASLRDIHFPQDKTHVLQICYLGLDSKVLTTFEIHGLTEKIIRTMLLFAKVRGFEALVIITFDFSGVDICVSSYDFQIASKCQLNEFVASNGMRPYILCPDSMVATLCWKILTNVQETTPLTPPGHPVGSPLTHEHKKPWNANT